MATRIAAVISLILLGGCGGSTPAPVAPPPEAPPVCFAADAPRHLRDRPLRLCASGPERCATIELATGALAEAGFKPAEPVAFPQAQVRTDDPKGLAMCTIDGKCARLGGNVANAIVALQAAGQPERLARMAGTTDLAAVMIPLPGEGVEVWSVEGDRKLVAQGSLGASTLVDALVIGNEVVGLWSPPRAVVYTSEGKRLPREEMSAEGAFGVIDGARWFAVAEWGAVTISDGDAAHTSRELTLVGDTGGQRGPVAGLVSDGKLVVSWGSKLYVIDPAAGAVTATWPVTVCSAP